MCFIRFNLTIRLSFNKLKLAFSKARLLYQFSINDIILEDFVM